MIHAYDELYLSCARRTMAQMLDLAVRQYGLNLKQFFRLFLITSIASRFQSGDCSIVAGRSGAELIEMVLEEAGLSRPCDNVNSGQSGTEGRSRQFWTGWALAYYQWYSGLDFEKIEQAVPIEEIEDMYDPYHEMDILQFCDEMNRRISEGRRETRLGYYRRMLGMSQRELAEGTGIPIRTIQQYEQRQKNINRARAEYMTRLAAALHCRERDLMEVEL